MQFNHNTIGNDAYGCSIISPLIRTLENQLNLEKSTATLFKRKANAPIHAKVGGENNIPDRNALNEVRDTLTDMRDNQEWVTPFDVEMNVLGFEGKVLDPA